MVAGYDCTFEIKSTNGAQYWFTVLVVCRGSKVDDTPKQSQITILNDEKANIS